MHPEIDVVIVTFNSADAIEGLLDTVPAAFGELAPRVVVVDNGSQDGTRDLVAARDCLLVRAPNHGYGAGVNTGVRSLAGTGPILVLNPDARLGAGSVGALLEVLERPGVGVAVPRLVGPDRVTARSLRREPTLRRSVGMGDSSAPALSEIVNEPAAYEREHVVDWATGAAMLISRECFERLDGFDELFFMYSEETDFHLRARDAGLAVVFTPRASVVHVGGGSGRSPELYAVQVLNRIRLYRRRHTVLPTLVLIGLTVAREAAFALRGDPYSRRAVRALVRPGRRPTLLLWKGSLVARSEPRHVGD